MIRHRQDKIAADRRTRTQHAQTVRLAIFRVEHKRHTHGDVTAVLAERRLQNRRVITGHHDDLLNPAIRKMLDVALDKTHTTHELEGLDVFGCLGQPAAKTRRKNDRLFRRVVGK